MCVRTSAIVAAILMLAALCPAPALAQTISSGSGYSITFNGNQQAFFSNTWDGSSQQAPNNIALSGQGSTAFGSSQYGSGHTIAGANDGVYGNNRSWLSNLSGTQASIGIAFPAAQSLSSIAWGRDNGRNSTATPTGGGDSSGGADGQFIDRVSGAYTLQFTTVASPGTATLDAQWTTIGTITLSSTASGSFSPWFRHEYAVGTSGGQPLSGVTGVRILAPSADIVDELEVYRNAWWTGGSAVWSSTTAWQTAASGGTSTTPYDGDSLAFAQATSSPQAVTLGAADRSTRALSFTTADPVTLTAGGTNRTLSLGWTGDLTTASGTTMPTLSVGSSAGAVTIGSQTAGEQVALALNASQTWTNDSANALTVNNAVSRVPSDTTSRTLTITGSGNSSIGGISDGGSAGSLALTKSGAGALTLIGANSYTGASAFNSGTVAFNTSANQTLSGALSGSAAIVKQGAGTLAFNGASTHSGSFAISSGTVQFGNTGQSARSLVDLANVAGAALALTGSEATIGLLKGGGSNGGNVQLNGATLRVAPQADIASVYNGVISGSGHVAVGAPGAGGALRLNAVQTFTGSASVSSGFLVLQVDNTLASTVAVSMSGGSLDISNRPQTIAGLAGSGGVYSFPGAGGSGGVLTLNVASGTTFTYGGQLGPSNPAFSIAKSGSGTQVLTGSNNYTGNSTVNAGTLAFATNALGSTGTVALNGGTLRWESGNTQDISSRLTIASGSAATIDIGANDVTFASNFGAGSTGSLTKTGAGRLTFTGAAGYTGATTISSGTLQVGAGGTGGLLTGNVVNNGVLVLNRSDTVALPGTLSGSGAVVQAGAGTVVFGGSSSLSGGISIDAGAVTARNASALGSGAVSVNAGGRLNANAAGVAVGNDLTLGGGTVSSLVATSALGGTFSTTLDGLYGLNTFTAGSDSFSGYVGDVDVLVVGGGGGGGSRFGGGGGAGGVIYQQGISVGSTMAVTVGAGGAGGVATGGAGTSGAGPGGNGQNSVFGSVVAFGGGGGGRGDTGDGLTGGSGGGAAGRFAGTGGSGTSSQGNAGGSSSGSGGFRGAGGGGAGAAGGASGTNGSGGIGQLISITGSSVYYGGGGGGGGAGDVLQVGGTGGLGGGGGGGNYTGTPAATAGLANTGGGGGGGAYLANATNQAGAAGGSGIVIVRYALSSIVNNTQTFSGGVTLNATSTLDAVRGSGGLQFTGAMSGAGGLTIASTGSGAAAKVIFDGAAKSYAGPTTVNSGADLRVNSDNSLATGAVTVNGRLGGSGALGGAVTITSGGVLAPGNSIESLFTGALSFTNGSTYDYEIDSSVPLSVGADFTKALGNLSLSGTVGLSLLNLATSPTAFADGTTFSLVNYTGSWNNGLFSVGGTQVSDGATFEFGSNTWRLNYAATSGGSNFTSDYTAGKFVNIVVVPEPGAIALAGIGIALAGWLSRRRK